MCGNNDKTTEMKQAIFNNWNLIRLLRLIMGIAILLQGIMAKDVLFAIAGLLFSGMAVFNLGCCATGNCATPPVKSNSATKDIHYEEVV